MAVAQQYAHTDSGAKQLLSALDDQINAMNQAHNTIEGIGQDVEAHYKGTSANLFIGKVNDWLQQYRSITDQVRTVMQSFETANQALNSAADAAVDSANSWSSVVFFSLTPGS